MELRAGIIFGKNKLGVKQGNEGDNVDRPRCCHKDPVGVYRGKPTAVRQSGGEARCWNSRVRTYVNE